MSAVLGRSTQAASSRLWLVRVLLGLVAKCSWRQVMVAFLEVILPWSRVSVMRVVVQHWCEVVRAS